MLGPTRIPFIIAAGLIATVGCGDDETATGGNGGESPTTTTGMGGMDGGNGGDGGQGGEGGDGGQGGMHVCGPTEGTALALTTLFFGQGPNGEWKSVGLDIDGQDWDPINTEQCTPNSGGDPNMSFPDGDDGIDNAFGHNVLPLILTFVPGWTDGVNNYLTEGRFNAIMKMYCVPEEGDAEITTKVFGGTELGSVPAYDGTDAWPVAPEVLGDPQDPESSTLVFENSTIIGNIFDSGPDETFILTIPIDFNNQSTVLKLTLHSAQVLMNLSDDRKSATGGVIGGVLNTEEVLDQVAKVGYMGDLCEDSNYQSLVTLIRQYSDIMTDGTPGAGSTCDGISFGVQFEMAEVQIGDVGPAAPDTMACP